jgi:hypothetical protein
MSNSNEPRSTDQNSNELTKPNTDDISKNLRVIFRRKRRLALAKQRQRSRCSWSVLLRVMFHVHRRVHRRLVNMFVRGFVGVNFVRVLHRRTNVVEPLD